MGQRGLFSKMILNGKVLPFPYLFRTTEWEAPAVSRRSPAAVRKLYSLPKFTNNFLKAPLVDAPILVLQSMGLLTEDGLRMLKDTWDRKVEHDLRRVYESSAMAIRTTSTASIVARAAIV